MTACAPTTLDEALAGAFLAVLTDSAQVMRLTRTPDASGGTTETYADQGAIPCHVGPTGGGELIVADRLGLVDTYTITVPAGTDVRVTDRLVANGLTFHVQYVPQGPTDAMPLGVVATVVA
jgi:head-tail adaptor